MATKPDREIAVALRYQTVPARADGLVMTSCLACRHPLDMHQPDPARPDRMLGTCDACGHWHVIDCHALDGSVVVAMLPESFLLS